MRFWVVIPVVFGLWWLAVGLHALGMLSAPSGAVLVAAGLGIAITGVARSGRTGGLRDRAAFRVAVIAEAVGIAGVLASCATTHRSDLIVPLIGAVVGLHFIPLARAFDDGRFVYAGVAMTVVSLGALWWPPPMRDAVAGIAGGVLLWTCASLAVVAPSRSIR